MYDSLLKEPALSQDIVQKMLEQAEFANVLEPNKCSDEQKTICARQYGPDAIDNTILISISENINKMADEIHDSEKQKSETRKDYMRFFKTLLVVLVFFAMVLICVDTFTGFHVRLEFLASVILAIIADVFAIVQSFVKYMTTLDNYETYNKLIDSLLKYINHGNKQNDVDK